MQSPSGAGPPSASPVSIAFWRNRRCEINDGCDCLRSYGQTLLADACPQLPSVAPAGSALRAVRLVALRTPELPCVALVPTVWHRAPDRGAVVGRCLRRHNFGRVETVNAPQIVFGKDCHDLACS